VQALEILMVYEFIVVDSHKGESQVIISINKLMFNMFLEKIPMPELSQEVISSRIYLNKLHKLGVYHEDVFTLPFNKLTEKYINTDKPEPVNIVNNMDLDKDSGSLMTYLLANMLAFPGKFGVNGFIIGLSVSSDLLLKLRFAKALEKLNKKGLIIYEYEKRRNDRYRIKLTTEAVEKLKLNNRGVNPLTDKIPESCGTTNRKKNTSEDNTKSSSEEFLSFISNDKIEEEQLFYNEELENNLDFYVNLLNRSDEDFSNNKLIRGKIILMLEGLPGTGKTAFANQLAKQTGRDVIHVQWHTIHDRFIGESEKRLKSVLDRIDKESNDNARKPVVIFNEAESFLSQRVNVIQSSDRMENAMVSMLLEWLEKREPFGIVVFTANYVSIIDKAFERRISRIKFNMPDMETRGKIWKHLLEELDIDLEYSMFVNYELTGADIAKNLRAYNLHKFAYGVEEERPEILHRLCANTKWVDIRPKVGFKG
jgi:AAA+ superfamily predicted ATPase